MCALVQCEVTYRRIVMRFSDGTLIVKIEPPGAGEVWRRGEPMLKLAPALMAIYEAALIREELRG